MSNLKEYTFITGRFMTLEISDSKMHFAFLHFTSISANPKGGSTVQICRKHPTVPQNQINSGKKEG